MAGPGQSAAVVWAMRRLRIVLSVCALCTGWASARSRMLMDEGWKFLNLESNVENCSDADFPDVLDGKQCIGLIEQAQVADQRTCEETCCGDAQCEIWQWCPGNSTCGSTASCWTGRKTLCGPALGWVSRGRTVSPAPAPAPGGLCDAPFCKEDYDDSMWRIVDLPHDMAIEGNFSVRASIRNGYLPYTKGWYRLHFVVPASAKGQSVWIDFDGVQRNSKTYLNGQFLGGHLSGYTPFRFDISGVSRYGENNVLAVYVDATQQDSWWYDGGGIYRHVWLNLADKVHIAPWGVYLPAHVVGPISHDGTADSKLLVRTQIMNDYNESSVVSVQTIIKDPTGKPVVQITGSPITVQALSNTTTSVDILIPNSTLWSDVSPYLYTCETSLVMAGTLRDVVQDMFGIRKVVFDKERGLLLNDKPVKVKGFANHQDFAGVGVAVPDSLQGFRVRMMKQMGANAWRTAHNPPNVALLDECDRQGLLVWDENHRNSVAADMVEDLRTMIMRDRNHPSVILWSLCNEALCQGFGPSSAKQLKSIIKELDPLGQRPVTAAMNGGFRTGFQDVLDVFGLNYHISMYDSNHEAHPNQPMIASETSSDFSDRSVYANDAIVHKYVSAYDVNYPLWGNTAEDAWCAIASRGFVAGGFYWTGFDYKAEPTPYYWPNVNSHFGVIDIAGFPKDNYFYHKSVFVSPMEQSVLRILPHWNWNNSVCSGACANGADGQKTVNVWAYTNGDAVELFLNNKSLGRKFVQPCRHVEWNVRYEAGELRAESYLLASAEVFASQVVVTTGPVVALALEVEWPVKQGSLLADGMDTALIKASLIDAFGRMVPDAAAIVEFSLSGPGRIIGLGNGDPSCHERDKPESPHMGTRSAWNGLARVVVQTTRGSGDIKLSASSRGLPAVSLTLSSRPVADYVVLMV